MRVYTLPSAHASYSDSDSDSASSGSISPPPSPVNGIQTFHHRSPIPQPFTRAQLAAQPPKGAITLDQIAEWEEERRKDPVARLAQTLLSGTSMGIVLVGREAEREDQMIFNHKVEMKGLPVADQKASGRCWLFAACNVLRVFIARKHKVDDFQLSQSYLHFWDHYSKAEYFLQQMLDLIEEPLQSRTMQKLMKDSVQDGGDYDLACSLIQRFGIVPRSVYPESFNSSNSAQIDTFLTSKLREFTLELRVEYGKAIIRGVGKRKALEAARQVVPGMMREIYRCIAVTLGTPPNPATVFHWSFNTTTKSTTTLTRTPLSLLALDVTPYYNLSQTLALMHDPREDRAMHAVFEVDKGRGMTGGRRIRYLNVELEEMKKVAVALIKAGIPIWFACDVDKASNASEGIMDLKLYNYADAFGTALDLTKAHRLATGDGEPTHAMVLTAVHVDPDTGKTVRWQVENSWGPDACNKGFWCMTDEWFDEHVYQIGAPRPFIPAQLLDIYDHSQAEMIPVWDPMA
ncbi:peptidase C1B, bleomycin hydrolase [Leucosporidium creatinivorum]|uniref:Cysteine proteinase 1, mitochondrial n=1 Tax=Leucosporidium creatinivorum TaxID=106004 RepID=A0A1Y2EUQ5_9BASI|nr:peptidase C1B, bleomycin hydrolase [Leucosporidium creatinivorum]